MELPRVWGATRQEVHASYACDRFAPDACESWFRALTVEAPRERVFRWLCQLKVAPYSYDWIDHFGRRSPRKLTPGVEQLEIGQTFMSIFELIDFDGHRQLTLRLKRPAARRAFGDIILTYALRSLSTTSTRLTVKMLVVTTPGESRFVQLRRRALAWGDLVMMRRQLRNLKQLAEQSPR